MYWKRASIAWKTENTINLFTWNKKRIFNLEHLQLYKLTSRGAIKKSQKAALIIFIIDNQAFCILALAWSLKNQKRWDNN